MAEYLYRNRPPWIGTQPDGYDKYTAWRPSQEHESGRKGQYFHGIVTYPEPLTLEQIERYELWSVNVRERAELAFYREDDWLRENYLSQPVNELKKYAARGDTLAKAALVLKGEIE